MQKWYILLVFPVVIAAEQLKIGLCIMATGKYLAYAERFIESARRHFFTQDQVTYYVFTDGVLQAPAPDIIQIDQKRLGWPQDTLLRCEAYLKAAPCYQRQDYMFASDADMLFVAPVGREILATRVATQHPGFVGKRGSYETNPACSACVHSHEGKYYFAGGFYGGSTAEFIKMSECMVKNIYKDFKKNLIAVWHDESHLNRYFIDHTPTKILNPSYCYPENWNLPYPRKLLALDKNHTEMRQ